PIGTVPPRRFCARNLPAAVRATVTDRRVLDDPIPLTVPAEAPVAVPGPPGVSRPSAARPTPLRHARRVHRATGHARPAGIWHADVRARYRNFLRQCPHAVGSRGVLRARRPIAARAAAT